MLITTKIIPFIREAGISTEDNALIEDIQKKISDYWSVNGYYPSSYFVVETISEHDARYNFRRENNRIVKYEYSTARFNKNEIPQIDYDSLPRCPNNGKPTVNCRANSTSDNKAIIACGYSLYYFNGGDGLFTDNSLIKKIEVLDRC